MSKTGKHIMYIMSRGLWYKPSVTQTHHRLSTPAHCTLKDSRKFAQGKNQTSIVETQFKNKILNIFIAFCVILRNSLILLGRQTLLCAWESTLGKYIRAENEQKHLMTRNPDLSARARPAVGEGDSPQWGHDPQSRSSMQADSRHRPADCATGFHSLKTVPSTECTRLWLYYSPHNQLRSQPKKKKKR